MITYLSSFLKEKRLLKFDKKIKQKFCEAFYTINFIIFHTVSSKNRAGKFKPSSEINSIGSVFFNFFWLLDLAGRLVCGIDQFTC